MTNNSITTLRDVVVVTESVFIPHRLPAIGSRLLICLVVACAALPAQSSGTTPFVLDGNRVYAQIDLLRPDGSAHRALAYVDMGGTSLVLADSVLKELQVDSTRPLRFRVGALTVEVPAAGITSVHRPPRRLAGSDLRVAAIIPASVLQRYVVVIDYAKRTLTLAQPGAIAPQGIAVPFQLDSATGLIAVNASIDGRPYAITIDNGSAYTWVRKSAANDWVRAHPAWARGTGAVGASNMMMFGDSTEITGTLMRIPQIALGSLTLHNVGVLAAERRTLAHRRPRILRLVLAEERGARARMDRRECAEGIPAHDRLPESHDHTGLRQSDPDATDQDQIGLTLRAEGGSYFVAGIATKNGAPTVSGVEIGDRLIKIGDLEATGASFGEIYSAMHGKPGETRVLVLERDGAQVTVAAKVTGF